MKNDNLNAILADLAEHAKPAAQIDLWPTLKKNLTTSDEQPNKRKPIMNPNPVLSRAAFAALALILVFAILLATPQGQAFAQELLKYFTTVSERMIPPMPTQVPAATYTLEAELLPPQPTFTALQNCGQVISPISSTFICQLQDAQSKLGFAIKSFPARYVQEPFRIMEVDQENQLIYISFSGYGLSQGIGDFPQDCPGCVIYEGAVQLVQVGAYQAEYAAGGFVFEENKSMVWDATAPRYSLRWKEGKRWYALTLLEKWASNGLKRVEMKAKMIQIAENLVTLEQGADLLSATNQPSIKDSAGFTIKEPGMLPEGFQQVPDSNWSNLTTMPRVGMAYEYKVDGQAVNFLTFYQMLIPPDYQTLRREFGMIYQQRSLVNGEWENTNTDDEIYINGLTGYYLRADETGISALYWRDEEREYLLVYQWSSKFGGRLDKETLIAIAESLK